MSSASEECTAYIAEMIPATDQRKVLFGSLSRILNSEPRDPKKLKTYVFYGTGSNGKATFLDFIRTTVGVDGILLTEEEITGALSMELMNKIAGKKLIFVQVTKVNTLLPLLKVLLSGCRLMCPTFAGSNARKIFTPTYDIILCIDGTFKPNHRVVALPFNYVYVQNPSPGNPKEKKSNDITTKFATWSPVFKQKLQTKDF